MTSDINEHLSDIVSDVARVRKALNDDERPPRIREDEVKSRLSDISNALDDLYNEAVLDGPWRPGDPIHQARP